MLVARTTDERSGLFVGSIVVALSPLRTVLEFELVKSWGAF